MQVVVCRSSSGGVSGLDLRSRAWIGQIGLPDQSESDEPQEQRISEVFVRPVESVGDVLIDAVYCRKAREVLMFS